MADVRLRPSITNAIRHAESHAAGLIEKRLYEELLIITAERAEFETIIRAWGAKNNFPSLIEDAIREARDEG